LTNVTMLLSVTFFILLEFIMLKFMTDSVREFKHVVWPTRAETKKYFSVVLIVLIIFGTYLFVFNYIFWESIFLLKDIFNK
jgi:preprotein translocase SecE subunit